MTLLLLSLLLLAGAGVLALLLAWTPRWSAWVGAGGAVAACLAGLASAVGALAGATADLQLPWMTVIGGAFHLGLDSLSGFFLVPVFVVCGAAALYGLRYLDPATEGRAVAGAWFFFNLLLASMVVVLTARNALLFLVAWEVMAVASFFLVTYEHQHAEARAAGRIYLIATHLGTAFLVVFMLIMAREAGSLEFAAWHKVGATLSAPLAAALFLCALIGFGTKAGFMPLHVWLPEAHPAAPSHVSAVMSGVMIKTGIYGLFRMLPLLGAPPLWWGWVLVAVGLSSGILGVLFALAQHDMKRLLAYHSVENIGIIALGMGLGVIGLSQNLPVVALFGFAGALLHVVNHALFKGLLFLGAGAVYQATHTREIDALGGVLQWMPVTGACFLVGATAIAGLPPLNGFVSEFLVYWSGLNGIRAAPVAAVVPLIAAVAGLALIGGLAAACFAKLFGIIFLGEPRSDHAARGVEAALPMRVAMLILAVACAAVGLALPAVVSGMRPVLAGVTGFTAARTDELVSAGALPLWGVALMAALLLVAVLAVAVLRRCSLAGKEVRSGVTWDCGYARPTPRMQYTASSFAQPLVSLFSGVLRSHRRFRMAPGLFPESASLQTETGDVFREHVFTPGFLLVDRWLSLLRWLQSGRLQLYILYIVLTLLGLLYWTLRGAG